MASPALKCCVTGAPSDEDAKEFREISRNSQDLIDGFNAGGIRTVSQLPVRYRFYSALKHEKIVNLPDGLLRFTGSGEFLDGALHPIVLAIGFH